MNRMQCQEMYRKQLEEYIDLVRVKMGGLKWRDLAELTGQSHQNLHQKIKRGSLNAAELYHIADVLGAQIKFVDKRTGKIII